MSSSRASFASRRSHKSASVRPGSVRPPSTIATEADPDELGKMRFLADVLVAELVELCKKAEKVCQSSGSRSLPLIGRSNKVHGQKPIHDAQYYAIIREILGGDDIRLFRDVVDQLTWLIYATQPTYTDRLSGKNSFEMQWAFIEQSTRNKFAFLPQDPEYFTVDSMWAVTFFEPWSVAVCGRRIPATARLDWVQRALEAVVRRGLISDHMRLDEQTPPRDLHKTADGLEELAYQASVWGEQTRRTSLSASASRTSLVSSQSRQRPFLSSQNSTAPTAPSVLSAKPSVSRISTYSDSLGIAGYEAVKAMQRLESNSHPPSRKRSIDPVSSRTPGDEIASVDRRSSRSSGKRPEVGSSLKASSSRSSTYSNLGYVGSTPLRTAYATPSYDEIEGKRPSMSRSSTLSDRNKLVESPAAVRSSQAPREVSPGKPTDQIARTASHRSDVRAAFPVRSNIDSPKTPVAATPSSPRSPKAIDTDAANTGKVASAVQRLEGQSKLPVSPTRAKNPSLSDFGPPPNMGDDVVRSGQGVSGVTATPVERVARTTKSPEVAKEVTPSGPIQSTAIAAPVQTPAARTVEAPPVAVSAARVPVVNQPAAPPVSVLTKGEDKMSAQPSPSGSGSSASSDGAGTSSYDDDSDGADTEAGDVTPSQLNILPSGLGSLSDTSDDVKMVLTPLDMRPPQPAMVNEVHLAVKKSKPLSRASSYSSDLRKVEYEAALAVQQLISGLFEGIKLSPALLRAWQKDIRAATTATPDVYELITKGRESVDPEAYDEVLDHALGLALVQTMDEDVRREFEEDPHAEADTEAPYRSRYVYDWAARRFTYAARQHFTKLENEFRRLKLTTYEFDGDKGVPAGRELQKEFQRLAREMARVDRPPSEADLTERLHSILASAALTGIPAAPFLCMEAMILSALIVDANGSRSKLLAAREKVFDELIAFEQLTRVTSPGYLRAAQGEMVYGIFSEFSASRKAAFTSRDTGRTFQAKRVRGVQSLKSIRSPSQLQLDAAKIPSEV